MLAVTEFLVQIPVQMIKLQESCIIFPVCFTFLVGSSSMSFIENPALTVTWPSGLTSLTYPLKHVHVLSD